MTRLASSVWSTLDSLPLAATTSSFLAVQSPQRPSYRTYTPHRNLRLSSTSSSSSLLLNYSPSSSSSSASVRSPSPPSLHNRVLCCRFPPKLPLLLLYFIVFAHWRPLSILVAAGCVPSVPFREHHHHHHYYHHDYHDYFDILNYSSPLLPFFSTILLLPQFRSFLGVISGFLSLANHWNAGSSLHTHTLSTFFFFPFSVFFYCHPLHFRHHGVATTTGAIEAACLLFEGFLESV